MTPAFKGYNAKLSKEAVRQYLLLLQGKPAPTYTKLNLSAPATRDEAKKARAAAGLSQSRFAMALGISPMTVQSWERGVRRPGGLESKILRMVFKDPDFIVEIMRA